MKIGMKVVIATGLVAVAASATAFGTTGRARPPFGPAGAVVKDQSRLPSGDGTTKHTDYGTMLLQLAQAVRPKDAADAAPGPATAPLRAGPRNGPLGPPPMLFGPGPRPPGPEAGGPPLVGGPLLSGVAPDRSACEDDIARSAALMGYLKSKLQLNGPQEDAWQKVEMAAQPVVDEMHKVCATLPRRPVGPPRFSAMIDLAEKQFTLRAMLVSAVAGPARHLYETLSPEQRAVFDGPPPVL